MAWRQLPDGSFFDPNTGNLQGLTGTKEAAARAQSIKAGRYKPRQPLPAVNAPSKFPPLPQNKFVVLPGIRGPQAIIDPVPRLAINPYELGMGAAAAPGEMSTTMKRVLVTGGIIAVMGGGCWLCRKMKWLGGGDSGKKKK
jgi:hypothetical protein